MTDDEHAIREVIATWLRASAAGDTPTVLNPMTDDAVFLVTGRAPFGKKEFAAMQEQGLGGAKLEGDSRMREIRVAGDWAFCITDLTVVVTPPPGGGQPIRRSGNTLSVFQRQPDGRWLLARDANLLSVVK